MATPYHVVFDDWFVATVGSKLAKGPTRLPVPWMVPDAWRLDLNTSMLRMSPGQSQPLIQSSPGCLIEWREQAERDSTNDLSSPIRITRCSTRSSRACLSGISCFSPTFHCWSKGDAFKMKAPHFLPSLTPVITHPGSTLQHPAINSR